MRRRHHRHGRARKTFGRVPGGGLFQMRDDPDNATLQKVSRTHYMVVTKGHIARGIKYRAEPGQIVKRGRQR